MQMLLVWAGLLVGLTSALVCPDGGMCEDKNTCCKNVDGRYGCCPLPHAECCSDHLHCCFQGTVCDLVHSKCVNKTVSLPLVRRTPAKRTLLPLLLPQFRLEAGPKAIVCPDLKSECPEETTCCQLQDRSWGCCPLAKAVCCEDHLHCCPEGTLCDVAESKCLSSSSLESIPMMKKVPSRRINSHQVTCPDGASSCPDETTCCQTSNSSYGCCPMPNAVCCSDHAHCCPSGTQCDLTHGSCAFPRGDANAMMRISAAAAVKISTSETELPTLRANVSDVPCDDAVACPDGNTCCKREEGGWACCPLPEAVCCKDHLHCCPHGTVCNLAASTCDDPAGRVLTPWFSRSPAFPLRSDNSRCDKSTTCPGKTTCCKTGAGGWACCPLPQAVCCEDHAHCCPHATICNLEEQTCDDPSGLLRPRSWVEKLPALKDQEEDQKCDKETMCPGGTTCCTKGPGLWACCPLPQAVCCEDQEHCCPKGYKCNLAEQTCDKPGQLSLPWLEKSPALKKEVPTLKEAVLALQKKVPALKEQVPAMKEVVLTLMESRRGVSSPTRPDRNMCDSETSCPRETTCCFMNNSGKWGCCPLPKAVCCEDGNHCCPAGHTCEAHRSSCSRGLLSVPWSSKVSALTEPTAATDVKCDDKSSCASGTTCCKMGTGEWGCCPLVKAVCCDDREHCCPQGYTCMMTTGTCEKHGGGVEDVIISVPQSSVVQSTEDIRCDKAGEFSCAQTETCCEVTGDQWACCPSPRAVCCPDLKHCCAAGYTCDLQAGGCTPEGRLTLDFLINYNHNLRNRNKSPGL